MSERLYFTLFYPFIKEKKVKRALVLTGPRRVSKTVMMFHSINRLLQEKTDPQKIFFIGIDNPIYLNLSLEDILLLCKTSLKRSDLTGCFLMKSSI